MTLLRHDPDFPSLDEQALAAWAEVPPAIASDCMNRSRTMAAAIKPLAPGVRLLGQARTVACMVGDNSAVHAALRLIRPGEVLVIAAGGHRDTALWGGLLTRAAIARGAAGVVIDGAVRDVAEIRGIGFPCFAAAAVPAGPHKGFGGVLDGVIACAGCTVAPGDLVLGDDDGVAVVPLARADAVLAACRARLAHEAEALERLEAGTLLADQMGIAEPDRAD
ncbi:MAG TPA: RraA family protein [Thermohalobaculum sp.]|nr:RraA family protein [Thermohalobaculum sp.]